MRDGKQHCKMLRNKVNRKIPEKIPVFLNKCLRKIMKVFWPDTIPKCELWKRTSQEPIRKTMFKRKWN